MNATRKPSRRWLLPVLAAAVCAAFTAAVVGSAGAAGGTIGIAGIEGAAGEGGPDFMEGMQVAVDTINKAGGVNGRKIVLTLYKTGGTPEGAVAAYRQAAANKNNIGSFLGSGGSLAVRAVSATVKMPDISASGNDAVDRPITRYMFSNSGGAEYATASVVYAFTKLHVRSVAVLHYGSDFSTQIESAIRSRCAQLGCKVTDVESGDPAASIDQLTPQLTKMKDSNPDAYYIEGLNPNGYAGAHQLGMFNKPVIAEQWLTVPGLAAACGVNCEGVVFGAHKCVLRNVLPASDPIVAICKQYVKQWDAYFKGKIPYSQFSIYGRDAVYTFAYAAKKVLAAGKALTRENVTDALEHINGDLTTTHGQLYTSPSNHRLMGVWTEGYVDTTIKMVGGKPTWVLAPKADIKGSTG